jgi:hypothetical protein
MEEQMRPQNIQNRAKDAPIVVRVPRSALAIVVAIIEGYEHFAVCRVVEPKKAIMEVYPSWDLRGEVVALLESLKQELAIKIDFLSK